MTDNLVALDKKLATSDLFKKMTSEKREELADAIYMSAVRSDLALEEVITIVRTKTALDETFFDAAQGNVFSYVPEKYRPFAQRIFIKKAGGGTPNAAMGKAELLLLLLSDKTKKPAKGDISFKGRIIEIKTNGGKLGLGNGELANKKVVDFCLKEGINLRKATTGKTAKGKSVFDPTWKDDRNQVGKRLPDVLAKWWEGLSGKSISKATWPKLRKAFLQHVADEHLTKPKIELLVFSADGRFRLFKNSTEFVRYYNTDKARFECRGYQKNPFSIYLNVLP
ncbi:MAG: hypothetical protein Q8O52_07895 [Sulfuritalea sp.]|nr:hypothetical protein [Sulfuritalea sp.]